MAHTNGRSPTWFARSYPVPVFGFLLLLVVAPREGCTFSIGPNGLCAVLRLDPQDTVLTVGHTFQVRINAGGCTGAAVCPCADSALAGASWRTDAPETASVNSAGLVTAQRPGDADIVIDPAQTASWRRTRTHVTVVP